MVVQLSTNILQSEFRYHMRNQINFKHAGAVSAFIPEPIRILGWKLEKKNWKVL